ncbi:deoxyguanosinetriphosphate triphosphohydrolase [Brackiella oedipodis]|uniref:deoxyguanosinetriphosphate triphosphohydrolase n=1 Tax=Brackiella oedipodis TaxID=124225 RepID=UPI000B057B2F|nr:deoxyguanosinetriphosphate triphosphohydrolase [Brackiella oedipodis]
MTFSTHPALCELAPYASHPKNSLGRMHAEVSDPNRNPFQRDKDRIIHCNAFRLLEYKTQVFVNHEGDLFRTRLTHSLEVAQIGRAIARNLHINEDLTEAICLAHDLGHTPFGHAGQDALNHVIRELAPEIGGFEHNLQSLRIVDHLEERYAEFNGLNLSFETRSGILKHCSRSCAEQLGAVGERFLHNQRPSLEAQIANLADEIAYNNHDIDDGLRSGLITLQQISEIPIFAEHYEHVLETYPALKGKRLIYETIRRMINTLIVDVTTNTLQNIQTAGVQTHLDVPHAKTLVAFSDHIRQQEDELKHFLMHNLYRHYNVYRMSNKAKHIIHELYRAFLDKPALLPPEWVFKDQAIQARAIADYIAGMTDRYAIREYKRIFEI